jgi:hypothetical protein
MWKTSQKTLHAVRGSKVGGYVHAIELRYRRRVYVLNRHVALCAVADIGLITATSSAWPQGKKNI